MTNKNMSEKVPQRRNNEKKVTCPHWLTVTFSPSHLPHASGQINVSASKKLSPIDPHSSLAFLFALLMIFMLLVHSINLCAPNYDSDPWLHLPHQSRECTQTRLLSSVQLLSIRDVDSIPGSGRSPGGGHGNAFQYSCLENPMDRGAWRAMIHRIRKSDMTESTQHMHTHIAD